MKFLIDGHNLIGSNVFPDIHLSDEDDEAKLVLRLKIWQSRPGKQLRPAIVVVFDRGIPGGIDVKMGGPGIEVIFAADPAQADDLIRRRLRKAKVGEILVTNDEALQREAALYGVKGWRGVDFVTYMRPKAREEPEAGTESDVQLSSSEIEEWLALFRSGRASKAKKRQGPPDVEAKAPPRKKRKDEGKSR